MVDKLLIVFVVFHSPRDIALAGNVAYELLIGLDGAIEDRSSIAPFTFPIHTHRFGKRAWDWNGNVCVYCTMVLELLDLVP